jgi:plastocyanin
MTRTFLILFLSAAALLLLSVTLAADAKQDDSKLHKVTIKNLKYDPANLSIKTGETVMWINKDDNDHTVTPDDADAFKPSDNLGSGDTFKYTFDKKGKFKYHCKYHPRMKGMVVVQD